MNNIYATLIKKLHTPKNHAEWVEARKELAARALTANEVHELNKKDKIKFYIDNLEYTYDEAKLAIIANQRAWKRAFIQEKYTLEELKTLAQNL